MNKYLLLFLFFGFNTLLLLAQPVITVADKPVAGDIFNYQQVKSAGVVPGMPGPNSLWDFSGLVDSGNVRLDSFLSVGAAPNVSLFPGTNLVEHGAGTSNNYNYYSSGASSFDILGALTPGDTTYFITPGKYLNYPFTYGSFFADSVVVSLHSTGLVSSAVFLDSFFVVGFGTLQLPGSITYNNVLQVREERTLKTIFGEVKTTTLGYFTAGVHGPLLTATNSNLGGAVVIEYLKNYIIIVPLKWLNVSANLSGSRAILNWNTADEINTSYFTIEKSTDAIHFSPLKNVNASTTLHSYSVSDDALLYGSNYYRIRQTDIDGKYSYSPVTSVNYSRKLKISVRPNLISNESLNFSANTVTATKAQVKIIGIEGKMQLTRMINLPAGNYQQQIDISTLPKGIYLLELNTRSEKQVTTFIKQ